MEWPQHPFWSFSLALYGRPGVEAACLRLQDEYDLDVNLVLFFLWAGVEGPGELTPAETSNAINRGQRWQSGVVGRIRAVRRQLKQDDMGADRELVKVFRPLVQALELQGEQVEQLFLAGLVPPSRGGRSKAAARANLGAYFAWAGLRNRPSVAEAIDTILDQIG